MKRKYYVLDVFADRPLAGNPLAVVADSQGLDTAAMQAIAGEFNLSETVFLAPPDNPRHSAKLRIFTPRSELPFAGHPTVGAAVLLGRLAAEENPARLESILVLEEQVGPVRAVVKVAGRGGHALFDVPGQSKEIGETREDEAVAAALGLLPSEICFENHVPTVFSAGVGFTFVPVRDLDVIAKARANPAAWDAAFDRQAPSVFLYCRETAAKGHQFHARMFAPTFGIAEDPATGSAVAALAGVILAFDEPIAGSHRYVVEQGFEMGRPSLIGLEIDVEGAELAATRIGGDAVVVAEGTIDV
jgi:trans-2,3-dihydro-3-hydroxyanthranilate isomerase